MKFSLIIPCYNEASNIPLLLERCKGVTENLEVEVILVDNGSTDNTQQVLLELLPLYRNCRSIRVEENQGYGYGILSGLNSSIGEIIGWTHADMQTDPQDFLLGIELFSLHGNDVFVKGVRFGRPLMDVFFTIGMSVFETILLRKKMWDINAQPTIFSRKFFESWQNPPHDFSLDLFAYYQARFSGIKMCRFPVFFGKRAYGVSKWNFSLASKYRFIKRTLTYSLDLYQKMKKHA